MRYEPAINSKPDEAVLQRASSDKTIAGTAPLVLFVQLTRNSMFLAWTVVAIFLAIDAVWLPLGG
jgi:hypothetical protein